MFIILAMASFALAFYALYFTCEAGDTNNDRPLHESFKTFGTSLITVFEAALGQFDFEQFDRASEYCNRPEWARHAGIFLLMAYLIIMAVLLMNLLIAVLSTAHAEVSRDDQGGRITPIGKVIDKLEHPRCGLLLDFII